jgi:hypothetical protein
MEATIAEQEERIAELEGKLESIRSAVNDTDDETDAVGNLLGFEKLYDRGVVEIDVYATNKRTGKEEHIGTYETASRVRAVRMAKKSVNAADYHKWATIATRDE